MATKKALPDLRLKGTTGVTLLNAALEDGMIPGALYARQSKTPKGSDSLEAQLHSGVETAAQHGVQIVALIIEPPSTGAFKKRGRERPMFPELIRLFEERIIRCVIAHKTDRLSRGGGPGWAPLIDAAEGADLDLDRFVLVVGQGWMSEFELGIRATMDREESKKTSDRLVLMHQRLAMSGRPAGGGNRPYGFEDDGKTIIEEEAEVLRDAAARYIGGESLRQIVRSMNDRGIKSATGKPWLEGTLKNTLKNPRIAGFRAVNGKSHAKAVWDPIIDVEVWDRCLARFATTSRGAPVRKYLLTSLMRCGRDLGNGETCPGRLVGAPSYGTYVYQCTKREGTARCGRVKINGPKVEELIIGVLKHRLGGRAFASALTSADSPASLIEDAAGEIAEVEDRLKALSVKVANDELLDFEYEAQRSTLMARMRKAQTIIEQNSVVLPTEILDGPIDEEWEKLSSDQQRAVISIVFKSIVVGPSTRRGAIDLDRVTWTWADRRPPVAKASRAKPPTTASRGPGRDRTSSKGKRSRAGAA